VTTLATSEIPLASGPGPSTKEEILARARAAVPLLRRRSEEIEQRRSLPPDVVELLRATGVFRMAMRKSWGGPELDSAAQTEVIEILSTGDTSAGWCAMIGMDTGIYAEYLDEAVAREMFPTMDEITAGAILPLGRAERVPGGFRVSGDWKFGSGITHSDWLVAGCFVYRDGEMEPSPYGGPAHWRIMFARPAQFEILDTWHTTGLRGSGSRDYRVRDLFVPEEHSFSLAGPRTPSAMTPPESILRNMSGVPLGAARAALDHVREMAATRINHTTQTSWREDYRVQTTIAEAEMELGAARDGVYRSLEELWELLEAGRELTPDQRVRSVLARVHSFRVARSVVSRLYDLVATSAIYQPSPLDRWLRDVNTMCQHVIAQDQILQSSGAFLLGGTPQNPFSLGIVK
jgi:indole-3-acetate monooxygenase